MLEVRNLSKYYSIKKHFYLPLESIPIFENLSFKLHLRENLLVCGESGSGKSTLAKILCMLQPASSGEIFFEDLPLLSLTFKQQRPLRQSIQYLFQDPKNALNPYKNIQSLIRDTYRSFNLPFNQQEILKLFEEFHLPPSLLSLKPLNLSGGQAQRIGLIRSLIPCPKVLILDEITSSLDLPMAHKILAYLLDLQQKRNISYIFISHQQKLFEDFNPKLLAL